MSRVTVHHLTRPGRLPLIEEEGLRTRADLSRRLGPPDAEDRAAPGRYAHGKRVSAFLSLDHARTRTDDLGGGLVRFTVDPAKAIGVPAGARADDPEAYWAAAKNLDEWLSGDPPDDLEVHQSVPVRAKYLDIVAPLLDATDLGDYADLVDQVADADRLSAKALMHLLVVHAAGDFDGPAFSAACALAWRDEPDPDGLIGELRDIGVDNVVSAALAEYGASIPDAVLSLRETLDDVRAWGDDNGLQHGEALFARTALELESLDAPPDGDAPPSTG